MGLNDFQNICECSCVGKEDVNDSVVIDNFNVENVSYYVQHIDELVKIVKDCHVDYLNAKLRYDVRKDKLQTTINWSEENALRESENLPKVTTQSQRDSVVNWKVKHMKAECDECEVKYKFYSRLYDFVSKNYELLYNMSHGDENL